MIACSWRPHPVRQIVVNKKIGAISRVEMTALAEDMAEPSLQWALGEAHEVLILYEIWRRRTRGLAEIPVDDFDDRPGHSVRWTPKAGQVTVPILQTMAVPETLVVAGPLLLWTEALSSNTEFPMKAFFDLAVSRLAHCRGSSPASAQNLSNGTPLSMFKELSPAAVPE